MHPLHTTLIAAANGRFPPVDGGIDVYPPAHPDTHIVAEFTGHAIVLTDRRPADVRAAGVDAFGGVTQPDFIRWLAGPNGVVGSHDVLLVGRGRGGTDARTTDLCEQTDLEDHPRVMRSRHHRRHVEVRGDESGFVTLGLGVVDRLEMSVELLGAAPGGGAGRRLIDAGLGLVPTGDFVWAQVAPGNAASLRAFLSCGFIPIGAETLIEPERARVGDSDAVVSDSPDDESSR